jgi:DNA-binding CsgD family transcriptional regulator
VRVRRCNRLTPSEVVVIRLLAEEGLGARDAELAEALGVCTRTVKAHLNRIYGKLDVPYYSDEGHPRVRLAYWWNCELFRIGATELGIFRDAHADGGPGPGLLALEATAS